MCSSSSYTSLHDPHCHGTAGYYLGHHHVATAEEEAGAATRPDIHPGTVAHQGEVSRIEHVGDERRQLAKLLRLQQVADRNRELRQHPDLRTPRLDVAVICGVLVEVDRQRGV